MTKVYDRIMTLSLDTLKISRGRQAGRVGQQRRDKLLKGRVLNLFAFPYSEAIQQQLAHSYPCCLPPRPSWLSFSLPQIEVKTRPLLHQAQQAIAAIHNVYATPRFAIYPPHP